MQVCFEGDWTSHTPHPLHHTGHRSVWPGSGCRLTSSAPLSVGALAADRRLLPSHVCRPDADRGMWAARRGAAPIRQLGPGWPSVLLAGKIANSACLEHLEQLERRSDIVMSPAILTIISDLALAQQTLAKNALDGRLGPPPSTVPQRLFPGSTAWWQRYGAREVHRQRCARCAARKSPAGAAVGCLKHACSRRAAARCAVPTLPDVPIQLPLPQVKPLMSAVTEAVLHMNSDRPALSALVTSAASPDSIWPFLRQARQIAGPQRAQQEQQEQLQEAALELAQAEAPVAVLSCAALIRRRAADRRRGRARAVLVSAGADV